MDCPGDDVHIRVLLVLSCGFSRGYRRRRRRRSLRDFPILPVSLLFLSRGLIYATFPSTSRRLRRLSRRHRWKQLFRWTTIPFNPFFFPVFDFTRLRLLHLSRPVLLLFAFSRLHILRRRLRRLLLLPRASSSRRCQHLRFPLQLLLRLSRAFHREFDRAPLTPPLRRWGDIFSLTPLTLKIIHHLFRWRSFSSHFLRDKREDSFTRLTTSSTTSSSSSFSSVSLQRDSRNLSNRDEMR